MAASNHAVSLEVRQKGKRSLLDYFGSTTPSTFSPPKRRQVEDIINAPSVPGLQVISSFVSAEEEDEILTFLDTQNWRTDLARRVIHYGGTYCLMPPRNATPEERKRIENDIRTAPPIPSQLDFLLDRMVERELYTRIQKPEYCIVNAYTGTQGISAHVENFKFDAPVCGLTLKDGDFIRFHELVVPNDGSVRSGKAAKAERTGRKVDVWLAPRSLLVMQGEARYKWQHEIVRSRKSRSGSNWRRVSLTFRTLKLRPD